MKKELKRLELKKLLKEFGFLKIDEEYKKAIQNQYIPEFNAAVNQAFKDHPDLDLLYNGGAAQPQPATPTTDIQQIMELEINPGSSIQISQNTTSQENNHQEHAHTSEPSSTPIPEPEQEDKTDLKKLYRKIATKTHPDKVAVKYLNDLYMKAQVAYESDDIFSLYLICNDLDIEYNFPDSLISDFKSKIVVLRKNNSQAEQTYWWAWAHEENEEKKRQLIFHFIANAYVQKFRT